MRITDVTAVPTGVRFAETFSFGSTDRREPYNVLVEVRTDSGAAGVGEACPVPAFTAESPQTVVDLVRERVAPVLVGADPRRRRGLLAEVAAVTAQAPFTRTAVDLALWDLAGTILGVPVSQLLGGAVREWVPQHGSVGLGSPDQMVVTARRQLEQGYRTLKLYAGREEPATDLARLAEVRAAVGESVDFLVDVNGRWDQRTALWAVPRLVDLGVVLLEQPLPAADLSGMAAVTARCTDTPMRVMADEAVYRPADVATLAAHGAAHVVNIGLSKLGGLTAAYECAVVAAACGLQVAVGSVLELGVASAAGLHLAACLPELAAPSYLVGPLKYERQVTEPPLLLRDAAIAVPTGPGLGVRVPDLTGAPPDRHDGPS